MKAGRPRMARNEEREPVVPRKRWCAGGEVPGAWWGVAAAELAGTAMLLVLTCLAVCAPAAAEPAAVLHRSLASGLVVSAVVQCFDHISGAMVNPTVTLAAVVTGRVSIPRALLMLAAQAAGAVSAVALLRVLQPQSPGTCLTLPRKDIPIYQAVGVEAIASGALALANCASWDPRTRAHTDSWPLRIGLIVAALSLAAGEQTGASMNPLRSLAPALLVGRWDRHWIYWVGPLGGGCVSAALYRRVFGASRPVCERLCSASAPAPALASAPSPALHCSV